MILHFLMDVRENGVLCIGGDHADHAPSFFRACLHDAIERIGSDDEP